MEEPEEHVMRLSVARDPVTGDQFYPRRALSIEGALRALEPVDVPGFGVLSEAVSMGERSFGYIDLPGGVRLISELGPGPHIVGANYRLVDAEGRRRFDRA